MLSKLALLMQMPQIDVDLMHHRTADNHPFFGSVVQQFFADARRRHRRLFVVPQLKYGVAICSLPDEFDQYFMSIDAAARRNCKKSARLGYEVRRIDFNSHRGDIQEIRQSATIRQGQVPESYLSGDVGTCTDPKSNSNCHDYAYFGTIRDERLYAYAGCFIAGELCMIQHILGHAKYQQDCVVPLLIVEIARMLYRHYPHVRYYGYGTYFGAAKNMRRFKRKFLFQPHVVSFRLN